MELASGLSGFLSIGLPAVMLFFVGLAIGRALGSHAQGTTLARLQAEMRSHDVEFMQLRRTAEKLRAEKQTFNSFLVHMSEFAREINTELDRKKLAQLVLRIVDKMFQARQILIFYMSEDGTQLRLEESKGLPDNHSRQLTVRNGEGRVGWVAEHQVTMDRDDFSNQSRIGEAVFDSDPVGVRLDLLAPMVHRQRTDGVICIGGAELQLAEQQKKMLKMAADFGSAALHNAQQFKEIESSANHDGLTKLFNKRYFMERFGGMIYRAEQNRLPLSVFLFDIDHFKTYNDCNGHLAGDEVLRTTGKILRDFNNAHKSFVVARYGGEEFVIAMPDTDHAQARSAAEAVRLAIQEHRFPNEANQPEGDLTISGGIGVFPAEGRNMTELLTHADQALYRAKAKGRNRVEAFEPSSFLGVEQEEVLSENS